MTNARAYERLALELPTPLFDTRTGVLLLGRSRDISLGGIFIETPSVVGVGTLVQIFVGGLGIGVQVLGQIVHTTPGQGFGARFTDDVTSLEPILERAAASCA